MRTNWRLGACHINTNNTTNDATSLAPHSITSLNWIFIFGRHNDVGEFNGTSFYWETKGDAEADDGMLHIQYTRYFDSGCASIYRIIDILPPQRPTTTSVQREQCSEAKRCRRKEASVKCINGVWRHHSRVHRLLVCLLVIIVRFMVNTLSNCTHVCGAKAKRKNSASFRCDVYFLTFRIIFLLPPSFDIRYDTCTASTQSISCLWGRERLTCRNSVRFSFWTNKHTINERQPSSCSYCIRKINDRKGEQQTIDTKRAQLLRDLWLRWALCARARALARFNKIDGRFWWWFGPVRWWWWSVVVVCDEEEEEDYDDDNCAITVFF